MLARVQSYLLQGIDAVACEVEVDVDLSQIKDEASQQPRATVVGLPDTAVKESVERVRSALGNSAFRFPQGKVVVNLAPAHLRKEGPMYDLPIAVGMLIADGVIDPGEATSQRVQVALGRRLAPSRGAGLGDMARQRREGSGAGKGSGGAEPAEADAAPEIEPIDPRRFLFAGELALDGRLRPVRGVIAMAALAKSRGFRGVIVPLENAPEAAVVPGVEAIGVATLAEVVGILTGALPPGIHPPVDVGAMLATAAAPVDFVDVRGQEAVKRAIVIAAAGSHNLLRLWRSGGCGGAGHGRGVRRTTPVAR